MATERKTCTCSAATSLLFCHYKPFVLPLQTFCSAATNRLFCHYKLFVLSLQAVCIATTSRLYCRYKQLVAHRFAKKPIARDAVCVAEVSVCAHNG